MLNKTEEFLLNNKILDVEVDKKEIYDKFSFNIDGFVKKFNDKIKGNKDKVVSFVLTNIDSLLGLDLTKIEDNEILKEKILLKWRHFINDYSKIYKLREDEFEQIFINVIDEVEESQSSVTEFKQEMYRFVEESDLSYWNKIFVLLNFYKNSGNVLMSREKKRKLNILIKKRSNQKIKALKSSFGIPEKITKEEAKRMLLYYIYYFLNENGLSLVEYIKDNVKILKENQKIDAIFLVRLLDNIIKNENVIVEKEIYNKIRKFIAIKYKGLDEDENYVELYRLYWGMDGFHLKRLKENLSVLGGLAISTDDKLRMFFPDRFIEFRTEDEFISFIVKFKNYLQQIGDLRALKEIYYDRSLEKDRKEILQEELLNF